MSGLKKNNSLPYHYSGKYTGSYAYKTIKDRLPIILVQVIDSLCRNKEKITESYGEGGSEDMKNVIGRLSCLQNEMVTNKPIIPLCDEFEDTQLWNEFLKKEEQLYDFTPAWFDSSWLYAECYFYRRIKQSFLLSSLLKDYDPFQEQKKDSFFSTMDAVIFLCSALDKTRNELKNCNNETEKFDLFRTYLEVSLWGNKWDLSLTAGKINTEQSNPLTELKELRAKILVNDTENAYQILNDAKKHKENVIVDFVLDNAGFELFGDLCFIHFLLDSGLVDQINVYPKTIPWFVSDTLVKDIHWLLEYLSQSHNENLVRFSQETSSRTKSGVINIIEHKFWTLPYDYSEMESVDPQLYQKLSESDLVIFKGDLNYRKLAGDRQWDETVTFKQALNGFLPTSVLALRAIKADVVVGLKSGTDEELSQISENWKFSGDYALVQIYKKQK
ncbi:damage-control phosphatase ARMT1 isoform X1 [Parasteatoda tepidariorum]|uniref:damage-control phosphatase ARMT1 isoform X1 n=2 Tax=Parasteatoda tepidariorum TaxID=114398 RepID=UPI001C729966|nr:damage-control phosphatase ARMT1 isoform X1 [Parasteatoda tepidariorum]